VEYFTNESSFVHQGERLAGYAVVTLHAVLEAKKLLKGTSAQKAELIALSVPYKYHQGSRKTSTQILSMLCLYYPACPWSFVQRKKTPKFRR
jgi:hypothetical protein